MDLSLLRINVKVIDSRSGVAATTDASEPEAASIRWALLSCSCDSDSCRFFSFKKNCRHLSLKKNIFAESHQNSGPSTRFSLQLLHFRLSSHICHPRLCFLGFSSFYALFVFSSETLLALTTCWSGASSSYLIAIFRALDLKVPQFFSTSIYTWNWAQSNAASKIYILKHSI